MTEDRTPLVFRQPIHPDPLKQVIPALGITLLAGGPGVGKTALLAWMARCFRDGLPIFGHTPTRIPAIGFINADRGWDRGAGEWFERAGFPEIKHYSMADDRTFNPRSLRRKYERTDRLIDFADRLKLPKESLLIVDPLGLFLGGNLLDYDSCAVACHEIRSALRERQLTLLGAAHSAKLKADKKQRYARAQDQILGSTALLGFTDTACYLAAPDETGQPYYTFMWNSHLTPPEVFSLTRDAQGLFVPYRSSRDTRDTRATVLALIPPDASAVTLAALFTLADAVPLSNATVKRMLGELQADGLIERVRHGVYRRVVQP